MRVTWPVDRSAVGGRGYGLLIRGRSGGVCFRRNIVTVLGNDDVRQGERGKRVARAIIRRLSPALRQWTMRKNIEHRRQGVRRDENKKAEPAACGE